METRPLPRAQSFTHQMTAFAPSSFNQRLCDDQNDAAGEHPMIRHQNSSGDQGKMGSAEQHQQQQQQMVPKGAEGPPTHSPNKPNNGFHLAGDSSPPQIVATQQSLFCCHQHPAALPSGTHPPSSSSSMPDYLSSFPLFLPSSASDQSCHLFSGNFGLSGPDFSLADSSSSSTTKELAQCLAQQYPGTASASGYFCAPPPPCASSSVPSALSNSNLLSPKISSSSTSGPSSHKTSAASNSCTSTASSSSTKGSNDRKRPYPCTMCQSKFGSKMELEEHQNSHTGMKPFQCDVCQSRFNRRSTLWNHKRIHSDAKPFKCTVCQMQFKWKNSLKCHKEMHLRKNELTQGAAPDNESQQLTYATAAKRTMEQGSGPPALASTPAMALLTGTASGTPSRLLTCAGTPRKRSPPKNGGGGGGGKGKQVNNNRHGPEGTGTRGGAKSGTGKSGKGPAGGTATAVAMPMAGGPLGTAPGSLFPFGFGVMMPEGKKEAKQQNNNARQRADEEMAALRREQLFQQQQHIGTGVHTSGFDLFRFPNGVDSTLVDNQKGIHPFGNDLLAQQQSHELQHSFVPLDHHHQASHQSHNYHLQQQQQLLDNSNMELLHSGNLLMDPAALLLSDFPQGMAGLNGGTVPFLGCLDLQHQLASLTSQQPARGNCAELANLMSCHSSSSAPSSASSFSASAMLPPSSGACSIVPCPSSSSASSASSSTSALFQPPNAVNPPAGFVSPCPYSTEMLLNGYQIDPNSVQFLAAAAEAQHQHMSEGHHLQQHQHPSELEYVIPGMNGRAATVPDYNMESKQQQGAGEPMEQHQQFGGHNNTAQYQIGEAGARRQFGGGEEQQRGGGNAGGIKAEDPIMQQQQRGDMMAMPYC